MVVPKVRLRDTCLAAQWAASMVGDWEHQLAEKTAPWWDARMVCVKVDLWVPKLAGTLAYEMVDAMAASTVGQWAVDLAALTGLALAVWTAELMGSAKAASLVAAKE